MDGITGENGNDISADPPDTETGSEGIPPEPGDDYPPGIDPEPPEEPGKNINNGANIPEQVKKTSIAGVPDQQEVDILTPNDATDDIWKPGDSYEEPPDDKIHWHQQKYRDTCAIVSQEYILDSFYDYDFSEEELVKEAIEKGYYIPGFGTVPDYVGNLLEDHGIEVQRSEGNTIDDIMERLARGEKIIVGVDANEIWAPSELEQLKDLYFLPEANHAVMVTGYNDQTHTVTLNDPGHPQGGGMEVALDDFTNAWQDSNGFMVAANKAPSMKA